MGRFTSYMRILFRRVILIRERIPEIPEPEIKKDEPKKLSIDELIKKEQQRQKTNLRIEGTAIIKNILGVDFVFDKESFRKFNEEFQKGGFSVEYDDREPYLIRKQGSYKEYFHRWLMNDEIERVAHVRRCNPRQLHVHHRNINSKDNQISNLVVMGWIEHRELHKKLIAKEKWKGSESAFDDWWDRHHKEIRDPTIISSISQSSLDI